MPTGYTAGIEDGTVTTLKQFALSCARAFGALFEMRDSAFDAPIPKFKPSPYHAEQLMKARRELAEVEAMTDEQVEAATRAYNESQIAEKERVEKARRLKLDRYQSMRAQVTDWIPPTKDHVGLKKFMVEQIDMCVESESFDLSVLYKTRTPDVWKAEKVRSLMWTIDYHMEHAEKEIQRTNESNAWVEALRESLK